MVRNHEGGYVIHHTSQLHY